MHYGQPEEMKQPPSQPRGHVVPYSRKTGKGTIIQEGHAGKNDPMVGTKAQPTFVVGAE